jgi:hypothetical protein
MSYRRATPEAALLHWLYLSNSPRSNLSVPPLDVDLDALDRGRLRRLSREMNVNELLEEWRLRAESQQAASA